MTTPNSTTEAGEIARLCRSFLDEGFDRYDARAFVTRILKLAQSRASAQGGEVPAPLAFCPITKRKFWGNLHHPELGMVATYGGPLDTYTVPAIGEDGELRSERYDQDAGRWIEGGEPVGWFYEDQQAPHATSGMKESLVGDAERPNNAVLVPCDKLAELQEDAKRLDFLSADGGLELSCGWDEERPWIVNEVRGGRNDREWYGRGRGDTAREAIDDARLSFAAQANSAAIRAGRKG